MPSNIPFTPQTDPANFPTWSSTAGPGESGHAFPRMLTRPFTAADVGPWLKQHAQRETATKEIFYLERCPKPGDLVPMLATEVLVDAGLCEALNEPIIVRDASHERAVLLLLQGEQEEEPETRPQSIEVAINDDETTSLVAQLQEQNERLVDDLRRAQRKPARRKRRAPVRKAKAAKSPAATVEPEVSDGPAS